MLTHSCSTHASFTPSPLPRPFMILCEVPRSLLAPWDLLGHQHFCAQCCPTRGICSKSWHLTRGTKALLPRAQLLGENPLW